MHTASRFTRSTMPSGASMTFSISGGPGTQTQITSDSAATSPGESTTRAPRASSGAAASRRTSWTTSGKPASRMNPAIGCPMFPRPMNPTFALSGMCLPSMPQASRDDRLHADPEPAIAVATDRAGEAERHEDDRHHHDQAVDERLPDVQAGEQFRQDDEKRRAEQGAEE